MHTRLGALFEPGRNVAPVPVGFVGNTGLGNWDWGFIDR